MNSRGIRGEQWDECGVCGFRYPMSYLAKQKGVLKCTRRGCWDNLDIEKRDSEIQRILGAGAVQEGADMRTFDKGFFEGVDEVMR